MARVGFTVVENVFKSLIFFKFQLLFGNYARWNHHKSFELQASLTFWVPDIFLAWNQNLIMKSEPSDQNLVFKWISFIVLFCNVCDHCENLDERFLVISNSMRPDRESKIAGSSKIATIKNSWSFFMYVLGRQSAKVFFSVLVEMVIKIT